MCVCLCVSVWDVGQDRGRSVVMGTLPEVTGRCITDIFTDLSSMTNKIGIK